MAIDLNADVGEGFDDAALLPYLSSVNIACGAHAGNDASMRASLSAALAAKICIGAHPGYADPQRFGREALSLSANEVEQSVLAQILRLENHARALDALTRASMQQWLLELWKARPCGVMFVTHDVDEALLISHRVLVMGAHPGMIRGAWDLPFSLPRDEDTPLLPEYLRIKREILECLKTYRHGV